jgi:hypothetical protein
MNRSKITKIFSSDLNLYTNKIQEIDKGVEKSFEVETKNSEKYFIKFLDSGYFNPKGFLAGPYLMKKIEKETEIPVANIHYISEEKPNLSSEPFYITEYIKGKNIDNYNKELEYSYYKKMFRELGKYIAQLNNIKIQKNTYGWAGYFEDSGIDSFSDRKDFKDYIYYMIKDSVDKIDKDNPMINQKENMIKTMRNIKDLDLDFESPCLTNYDIKFNNLILYKNNKNKIIKSIIDWDNPILGTPLFNIIKIERRFVTGANKNLKFDKRSDLFRIFLESYNNFSKNYEISIHNNIKADIFRILDYIETSKHFDDYYGNLEDKKQRQIYDFYSRRIRVLSNKIELEH